MKKLLFVLILLPIFAFAQKKLEKQLDSIVSADDAKSFIKNNANSKGKLITFNSEKHKTQLAKELFELSEGGKKSYKSETGKTYYKIISKEKTPHYKASIMEFDSKKTPLAEINSLRSFILKGINAGEHKFENLARVYSSHPTAKTGGDLGWLKTGTLSKRFEKAIRDKKSGQLFTFDEYRKGKHYIILKTDDNKAIEEITVLKITETK